jgi:tripeptidyl-peptidase-1
LVCEAALGDAERALGVVFGRFSHPSLGTAVRSVRGHYTVPSDVAEHISFIGGVHRFPSSKHLAAPPARPAERVSAPSLGADPHSLRRMYNVSNTYGKSKANSQAVASFLAQHMEKTDLIEFRTLFDLGIPQAEVTIRGPNGLIAGVEASLDIQYITALGANIPTIFWNTPGLHDNQEPFLAWLYDLSNTTNVPYTHSASYGDDEDSLDVGYMTRVNVEFMKAAARGLSILFASGDSGAECGTVGNSTTEIYTPNFPVSSPWVTAVGGTDGRGADYISGGGFSNVFSRPTYQASAVLAYLNGGQNNHVPPAKLFNASGRAYPDLAAQSEGYTVIWNLIPMPGVAGTSASTPVTSGIISLINDLRLQSGKRPLGFLNPWLYSTMGGGAMDVTQDCNAGCQDQNNGVGFCAVKGWDPVTGWGEPNYGLMAERMPQ